MKTIANTSPKLLVLSKQTPMQARISDHNILINNNILNFNMMMQCRWNADKKRFNNGFGSIETDSQYQNRISMIVQVLAEAVALNPQIDVIGLAEAPIKKEDIAHFIQEASKYPSLVRFKDSIQPMIFTPMGVATFVDTEKYTVDQIVRGDHTLLPSLQDRIQEFVLTGQNDEKQICLINLHLPYDLAKSKDSVSLIRFAKKLFQSQHQIPVVVMGDFNIDPRIIAKKLNQISFYIQEQNNLLINTNPRGEITGFALETVDGILKTLVLANESPQNYVDVSNLLWNGGDLRKEKRLMKAFLSSTLSMFKANKVADEQDQYHLSQLAIVM